jgi:hypothetical protein
MQIKELITMLNECDAEAHVNFYHLENYNLENCFLESILDVGAACEGEVTTVEITIKPEGSDEGGNYGIDDEWTPSAFN